MYQIIYDYCTEYSEGRNVLENFYGDYDELQAYIDELKRSGCYNFSVAEIYDEAC